MFGFNEDGHLLAAVDGVGAFVAADQNESQWAEYGARIGYAVTANLAADIFIDGISGNDGTGTRVHGGGELRYRF